MHGRRVVNILAIPAASLQPFSYEGTGAGARRALTRKERKNCWTDYLEKNSSMKIWAEANLGVKERNKNASKIADP